MSGEEKDDQIHPYGDREQKENFKRNRMLLRETGLTYDDYANMPDDGMRYELAGGVLELLSSPTSRHQFVNSHLYQLFIQKCEGQYHFLYAPLDVILSNMEVRQPDLIAIRKDRSSIITKRGIEGPPDLVVEILSPSTRRKDKLDKVASYGRHGVAEYWIVEPETGVLEQYVRHEDRLQLTDVYEGNEPIRSELLPCVTFSMSEVMKSIPDFL